MEPPGLPPNDSKRHINKLYLAAESTRRTELGNTAVRHYNDFTVHLPGLEVTKWRRSRHWNWKWLI